LPFQQYGVLFGAFAALEVLWGIALVLVAVIALSFLLC